MKPIIFKESKDQNCWYSELEGKIIDLDKVLDKEDEEFYYVKLKSDDLPVPILKEDTAICQEIEVDLPNDVIEQVEKLAKDMKISRDEMFNIILKQMIEKEEKERGK